MKAVVYFTEEWSVSLHKINFLQMHSLTLCIQYGPKGNHEQVKSLSGQGKGEEV